jgi:hypothetical protein
MNSDTPIQAEHCDLLRAFCEEYIRENGQNLIDEAQLAQSFVKFFGIPTLFDLSGLDEFFCETNIDLRKGDLPVGLLGVNMSCEGKRIIDLSERPEQKHFQVHTALHEIREIIENDFRSLGFGTVDSQSDIENCADKFAFCATVLSQMPMFAGLFTSASEIESNWQRVVSLILVVVGASFVGLHSYVGAFHPHVAPTPTGTQFKR